MKSFLIVFLVLKLIFSKRYTYNSYDEINQRLFNYSVNYPDLIVVDTSQSRYNLDSLNICGDSPCKTLITIITNFAEYSVDKPQIYFSGLLHGNERLGANVLVELAEFLVENYDKNSWIKYLLDNRVIVMTPMTNTYGYYYNKREDKIFIDEKDSGTFDPNRDFPYFSDQSTDNSCMNTITARTVNELFREFLFSLSITFHGGDNIIGYPWGNFAHLYSSRVSKQAPDLNAARDIGYVLQKYSSSKNALNRIIDYSIGEMTNLVYAVEGGMEDWAYAAGWENELNPYQKPIKTCSPNTFSSYPTEKTTYDNYPIRSIMYLIESYYEKRPNQDDFGESETILDDNKFMGHIPRNIRLSLAAIDMISPYVLFKIDSGDVRFKLMGCKSVETFEIIVLGYYESLTDSISNPSIILNKTMENFSCYWNDYKEYNLKDFVNLEEKQIIFFKFRTDSNWFIQDKPDPNIPPQSFVVFLRSNSSKIYSNPNYLIKGNDYFLSNPIIIEKNLEKKVLYEEELSINNMELVVADNLREELATFEIIDLRNKSLSLKTNNSILKNAVFQIFNDYNLNFTTLYKMPKIGSIEFNCEDYICRNIDNSSAISNMKNILGSQFYLKFEDRYFFKGMISLRNKNCSYISKGKFMNKNSLCITGAVSKRIAFGFYDNIMTLSKDIINETFYNNLNKRKKLSEILVSFKKIDNLKWKVYLFFSSKAELKKVEEVHIDIPFYNETIVYTKIEIMNNSFKIIIPDNLAIIGKEVSIRVVKQYEVTEEKCIMITDVEYDFRPSYFDNETEPEKEGINYKKFLLFMVIIIGILLIIVAMIWLFRRFCYNMIKKIRNNSSYSQLEFGGSSNSNL